MLKDKGLRSTQMLNEWVMRILTTLLRVTLKRSFSGCMPIVESNGAYLYCHETDSWVRKILVKPLSNQNLFFRDLWGVGTGFG